MSRPVDRAVGSHTPRIRAGRDSVGPHGRDAVGPFVWLGRRWTVSSGATDLLRLIEELYQPLLAGTDPGPDDAVATYRLEAPSPSRRGELFCDGRLVTAGRDPARLFGQLIWSINRHAIDDRPTETVLHSAAAADDHGRVVLLPAAAESGKTTLVTGLVERGAAYLTDEAAIVDEALDVHGFAKPLSIDKGSWTVLSDHAPLLDDALAPYMAEQWQVPAHRFGSVVPSGKLSLIVFPDYVAGAPTSLERIDRVHALDLARASTFGTPGRPVPGRQLAHLARMVTAVPSYTVRSGDLAGACAAVLQALEDHADDS